MIIQKYQNHFVERFRLMDKSQGIAIIKLDYTNASFQTALING